MRCSLALVLIPLCAGLALTATASPQGERRYVPGDGAISLAALSQSAPAIARGEGATLIVWTDQRANPYGGNDYETSADIYGMRFDAEGNPIDVLPFPVVAGAAAQQNPKVAWNGSEWLVVFESYLLGGT